MLISHKKQFIFIHIFKTAGTSLTNSLVSHSRFIDRLAYEFTISTKIYGQISNLFGWQDDGHRQFTGFHKHELAHNIKLKMGNDYDNYFTFCFVRNPYDLLVSLYFYIKQNKSHKYHKLANDLDFNEFVDFYIKQNPPLQSDYIYDPQSSEKLVNFIGFFENLNNDFSYILSKLDINISSGIKHKNISLKRKSKGYKNYYNDESKRKVLNYFAKDLTNFNYEF